MVKITSAPSTVKVSSDGSTIKIVHEGAQGIPGITSRYDFTQSSASSTWTINHNLGKRPDVSLYSPGGVAVFAQIVHISSNQVQVMFSTPYSGSAVCIA